MNRCLCLSVCLALLVSGCATNAPNSAPQAAPAGKTSVVDNKSVVSGDDSDWGDDGATVEVRDPMEPMNRSIFRFNDHLYRYVAKPFSRAYEFIFPDLARRGIRNAYENVRFPVRFVNHTLQGRFDRGAMETGRFLVNTTAGIGGLMTPSDKIPALADLPKADTGQTFAKWGISRGPYFVVPALGPSTPRELAGTIGDAALNPLSWLGLIIPGAAWTLAITVPDSAHKVPDQMHAYDTATEGALDPYISTRTAYIQLRDAAAKR